MIRAFFLLGTALAVGTSAMAQEQPHAAHTMPAPQSPQEQSAHDMSSMDAEETASHDADKDSAQSGEMSAMDHAAMGHATMAMDAAIPETAPPPEAYENPGFAADAFVGADVMSASRAEVIGEIRGPKVFWVQGDRLEYRARQGEDGYLFDLQGYYGGDLNKLWFKAEGEGAFGEDIESAEVQALYSRAIAPFFDVQLGVKQDLTGPERTHLAVGIQGLVPYEFEVDTAAFLSTKGDLTARIEGEVDQRITQRLILQPRAELSLAAQDIPEIGVGAGLDSVELGVRLRYEFAREFAPYIGVDQEWKLGGSADFARLAGEDSSVTNYVVGIRFWF